MRRPGVRGPVERYGAVLEEIADQHRGESVLVGSHGGVVALEADDDGWVARSRAGTTL